MGSAPHPYPCPCLTLCELEEKKPPRRLIVSGVAEGLIVCAPHAVGFLFHPMISTLIHH